MVETSADIVERRARERIDQMFSRSGEGPDLVRMAEAGDLDSLLGHFWPGLFLDDHQLRIVRAVLDPGIREVFVKGASKTGKGTAVAIAVCLWYRLYDDSRVVITSSSYEHAARDVMFPEIARWYRTMRDAPARHLLRSSIEDPSRSDHTVRIANPLADEGFSGRHGVHVLFVLDEATAVHEDRYRLSRTQSSKFVALANPRTVSGWYRNAFPSRDPDRDQDVETGYGVRRCITVDAADTINVRSREVKVPGMIDYQTYLGHTDTAENEQWWIDVFAHGHFPASDPGRQVILGEWLHRHVDAWRDGLPATCFSLDVARSEGGDDTIFAAGSDAGIAALRCWKIPDTMKIVGNSLEAAQALGVDLTRGQNPIVVDADGLGAGTADRLRELGCWVIDHRGAVRSRNPDRYVNVRAESYGELARRLDPRGPWGESPWPMPDDHLLHEDLVVQERVMGSDWPRLRLLSKTAAGSRRGESVHEKLGGRSPDRGDAVAYLYLAVRTLAGSGAVAGGEDLLTYPMVTERDQKHIDEARGQDVLEWLSARGRQYDDGED